MRATVLQQSWKGTRPRLIDQTQSKQNRKPNNKESWFDLVRVCWWSICETLKDLKTNPIRRTQNLSQSKGMCKFLIQENRCAGISCKSLIHLSKTEYSGNYVVSKSHAVAKYSLCQRQLHFGKFDTVLPWSNMAEWRDRSNLPFEKEMHRHEKPFFDITLKDWMPTWAQCSVWAT